MKTVCLLNGTEFTYGQNAQENSELTRTADENHIWMHADDVASAHGILHTEDLFNSDIHQAASIIKQHSKAKHQKSRLGVSCVKVKYVEIINSSGTARVLVNLKPIRKTNVKAKARVVFV